MWLWWGGLAISPKLSATKLQTFRHNLATLVGWSLQFDNKLKKETCCLYYFECFKLKVTPIVTQQRIDEKLSFNLIRYKTNVGKAC